MATTILIVEDEPAISFNVEYALKQEGFRSESCGTCEEARALLKAHAYALVILDIGLPDGNGFDFCREIRRESEVPVIMLTARSAEVDRVAGLELGADDYVVKPFSPRELVARVRSVLRRAKHEATGSQGSESATPFGIDEKRMAITYFSVALNLSRYEFHILKTLIRRPGWVFSREKLMELIWDAPESSMERTVDAHIKTLRAKLREIKPEIEAIRTHRAVGYSLLEKWDLTKH